MMINAVSFTGRENMLTKGLKSAGEDIAVKTYEYLGAGKIFKNAETEPLVQKVAYRSPFELINTAEEPVAKIAKNISVEADQSALSYAVSHGNPIDNVGGRINIFG